MAGVQSNRPSWGWKLHAIFRPPEDDFFSDGDALCQQNARQLVLSEAPEEEEPAREVASFRCQAVDCRCTFTSIRQFEAHYNSQHRHPCIECRRSFPTSYLLDLHIVEWHDPMFDLRCHSHNMYQCLLETCPEKFKTYQHRRDHMIRIHKYPANFRFEKPPTHKKQTNLPVRTDRNPSGSGRAPDTMDTTPTPCGKAPLSLALLARGRIRGDTDQGDPVSGETMETMDTSGSGRLGEADDLTNRATHPRKFVYKANVPRTVCFGAGSQRGFLGRGRSRGRGRGRHWHQTKTDQSETERAIEDVNMDELREALDPS